MGQVSPYPQIQELLAKKEPFDKLWKTAVEFQTKHDQWMNGPLLNVNAEIVEDEVSSTEFIDISIFTLLSPRTLKNRINFFGLIQNIFNKQYHGIAFVHGYIILSRKLSMNAC